MKESSLRETAYDDLMEGYQYYYAESREIKPCVDEDGGMHYLMHYTDREAFILKIKSFLSGYMGIYMYDDEFGNLINHTDVGFTNIINGCLDALYDTITAVVYMTNGDIIKMDDDTVWDAFHTGMINNKEFMEKVRYDAIYKLSAQRKAFQANCTLF